LSIDPLLVNNKGNTALHDAVYYNKYQIIELILSNISNKLVTDQIIALKNKINYTPIMIAT